MRSFYSSNNYMKARCLNLFGSKLIKSWQQDLTRCALQYEIITFVTMATYWIPDLPNVRGFSGFFWHSTLIFFSDALFARYNQHINVFKVDYLSKSNFSGLKFTKIFHTTGRTGIECLSWKHNSIISESLSPLEL